jgi:GlpG protein
MRLLVTFPDGKTARKLADHLLTLQIQTSVQREEDGWGVWVQDEDKLPPAREELSRFQENPADARYSSAAQTAAELREEEDRLEADYRRRTESMRRKMRPGEAPTPVTLTLIALSVLVAVGSNLGSERAGLLQWLSITSYVVTPNGRIIDFSPWLAEVRIGQVWRVVTPIFIHFGLLHLVFNLSMLYTVCRQIEARRGSWRYLLLVLLLAVVSNLAQYQFGHIQFEGGRVIPFVSPLFGGLSGVLYGLFGYVWMKARFEPELRLYIDPTNIFILMAWFVLCWTGLLGPIANMAHTAGLVLGMVVGVLPTLWRWLTGQVG